MFLHHAVYSPQKRFLLNHAKRRSAHGIQHVYRTAFSSSASSSTSSPLATTAISFGIGTLAGTAGSLAGMGGGFIMIPLMTWLLKLSQHQAHGTSLFAVTATGVAGAVAYGPDAVHYETAAAVAVCGMVSARWGARLTHVLTERTLKRALGVLMLAMAPIVPLKAYFMQQQQQDEIGGDGAMAVKRMNEVSTPMHVQEPNDSSVDSSSDDKRRHTLSFQDYLSSPDKLLIPCGIGLCSGFLAGVFGVGGGVIVVPALTLASRGTMTHHEALGTSLAAMALPAAVGTWTHSRAGNVAMRVAPALSMGALLGAYAGGKLAMHTNELTLRWGFSGLLATVGLRTIAKA